MIKKEILPIIAVFIFGFALLHPTLDFQPLLATGDHGRDLYCFKKVSQGAVPYRDFWWQYGPLMPYYYALLFKLLGTTLQTVLFGKALIIFGTGLFFYLSAKNCLSLPAALIATFWFWTFYPDFFYTYCHDGGVLFLVFIFYCLTQYQKTNKLHSIFGALIGVFFLNLIRINIGMACLLGLIVGVYLSGRRKKTTPQTLNTQAVRLGLLSAIFLTVLVYFYFVKDLTPSALKQCFPYLSSYRYDASNPIKAVISLSQLSFKSFFVSWATISFGTALIACIARSIYLLVVKKIDEHRRNWALLVIYSLLIFLVFNIHEFLFSNFYFRIFWVFPFFLLLFFVAFDIGLLKLPQGVKAAVLVLLVVIGLHGAYDKLRTMSLYKVEGNFFQYGQNRVYIANFYWWRQFADRIPDHATASPWIKAVSETTDYLKEHVSRDKVILAIPYDPLYYFLSGRDSAVYPLAFFDYIGITEQDEIAMINQLEEKNVNYVIISNRAYAEHEPYLGSFGKRYCPLLSRYLLGHFEEVATIGEWEKAAGFAWNHGVKIIKRKEH